MELSDGQTCARWHLPFLVELLVNLFSLFRKFYFYIRERGGNREISPLLVHSPNAERRWGWPRLKLGTRNLIWVSHMHLSTLAEAGICRAGFKSRPPAVARGPGAFIQSSLESQSTLEILPKMF